MKYSMENVLSRIVECDSSKLLYAKCDNRARFSMDDYAIYAFEYGKLFFWAKQPEFRGEANLRAIQKMESYLYGQTLEDLVLSFDDFDDVA